jgi:hypothetical protein
VSAQRLPAVVLTCRNNHEVSTRARGGQAVKCPECKTSVWVPASRPTNENDSPAESDFAQRWKSQTQTDPADALTESRYPCQSCGSVRYWEPGRTLLICPQCQTSELPPTVGQRYAEIEVVRKDPAAVALERIDKHQTELKQRMKVVEERDRLIRITQTWIDFVDPDALESGSPLQTIAIGMESNLRHIVTELRRTEDPHEIVAIKSVLSELVGFVKQHDQQIRDERKRVAEDDDEDEYEDDEYEDDEDDEEEYAEAEVVQDSNPAGLSSYQRLLLANTQTWNQNRPALYPPRQPDLIPAVVATIPRVTAKNCQFDHFWGKAATHKLWGADTPGGPLYQGRPIVYTCAQHYDKAVKWLEANGYPNATFELLETTS